MAINLIHLANMNSTNIGNGALLFGTERVLNEDSSESINWSRAPWDDYTFGLKPFDRSFVDMINSSDGLIVGGAVTMNGGIHYGNAGMRVDLPLDLWRVVNKPVVFHGISYRHWDGQEYHHLDRLQETLDFILTSPLMFLGVRNDGTEKWLEDFVGVKSERVIEVPDPGFFIQPDVADEYPEIRKDRCNIIIAFNNEDSQERFKNIDAGSKVVRSIARMIESIAGEREVQIILVPHYLDDYKMMSELVDCLQPRLAHQCMASTGLVNIRQAKHFYGRYTKADLIVSMRVHSMSPAIGMGLPVIPLVSQDRMRVFLKNSGLEKDAVDVFDPSLDAALLSTAKRVLSKPEELRERYSAAFDLLRGQMRDVNGRVMDLIGGSL